MKIAIVGGGIVGLGLALNLHQRGIASVIFEAAPEMREIGVGITILPHAMRELAALGLQQEIEQKGIENRESCFFNRFGQLIFKEPRGRYASYPHPEVSIHRGKFHKVLWDATVLRLGRDSIRADHRCVGYDQAGDSVSLRFEKSSTGAPLPSEVFDLVIGCDGVNSAIRRQMLPDEGLAFTGINTWRGVTRAKPFLTGKSYVRVGSIKTAKIVIYPIIDAIDDEGNQLINWTTEITSSKEIRNDWNKPGNVSDFIDRYSSWTFDWLDIPDLIRRAETVFEYPMVDKDPIDSWTRGRVTLAGDAAHPMYPRGSNGSAQGLIDSRVLADAIALHPGSIDDALKSYEAQRVSATAKVVEANRAVPPDYLNIRVEELTGDKPFDRIEDVISQEELRALSDNYKNIAGFVRPT